MTLALESKNFCNSGTRRWVATSASGEKVGTVLRGNRPFAPYRLLLLDGTKHEFANQKSLLEFNSK